MLRDTTEPQGWTEKWTFAKMDCLSMVGGHACCLLGTQQAAAQLGIIFQLLGMVQ